MAELSIRIDFGPGQRLGPGKIALLEKIGEAGSIAAGGRMLGMSYRRAWLLIDEINTIFGQPVVTAKTGGAKGGGAELTPLGRMLITRYRAIEKSATAAAARQLAALNIAIPAAQRKKRKSG